MEWFDAKTRVLAWLRANRGPCLWLAGGAAALGAFWLARGSAAFMEGAVRWFAAPAKRAVSAAADLLPFSLAEALCTALGLWAIAFAAGAVRRRLQGRKGLARRLVVLAAVGLWVWAGVCWLWGAHYYAGSFSQKSGLAAQPVSAQQLKATALLFAQGANRTGAQV